MTIPVIPKIILPPIFFLSSQEQELTVYFLKRESVHNFEISALFSISKETSYLVQKFAFSVLTMVPQVQ